MIAKENLYIADSKIHGKGLFSLVNIKSNEVITLVAILNESQDKCIQITDFGGMVNHQKNGNVIAIYDDRQVFICAIKDIPAHTEITSDYSFIPPFFSKNTEGYKEL